MSFVIYWLPILVSAVVVFIASAAVWMAFKWHNRDYRATADEEAVRSALRGNAPGWYLLPYCMDQADWKKPEVRQKFEEGPLAYITVVPSGMPRMGGKLAGSFVYNLVVGVLVAYVLSLSVTPGAEYLEVFRVACTVAFIAYGIAYIQDSIWFGRPWAVTARNLLDALIYGLLTGGVFGWLG